MVDESRSDLAAKVVTGAAWSLWNNINEVRVGGVRKVGDVLMRGYCSTWKNMMKQRPCHLTQRLQLCKPILGYLQQH